MGNERSIPEWFPQRANEEMVRRMAGDRFDPDKWHQLAVDGWIKKSQLEQEARRVERYDGGRDGRGMRHGVGTCQSGPFDQYMGQWHSNRKHGLGVQTSKPQPSVDSVDTYQGEWKRSTREGHGHVCDAEGTEYWGQWEGGQMHGVGVLAPADGYVYQGQFAGNLPHGHGLYIRPSRPDGGTEVLPVVMPGRYERGVPVEEGGAVEHEATQQAALALAAKREAEARAAAARLVAESAPVSLAMLAAKARLEMESKNK